MAHSLHHQNIQTLEIKLIMDFQEPLFWICFIIITKTTFIVFDLNQMQYKPVQYFGPVICNDIPIEIISIKNFDTFNTEIRKWEPKN